MISFGLRMAPGRNLSPLEAAFCAVPLIFGKERRRIGVHYREQSAIGLVGRSRYAGMGGAQRRRPALAQIVKIGLARLDAVVELGVIVVATRDQDIKRQTDAEIRAHGGVDRNQA